MDPREQRGLLIAATTKLWTVGGGTWMVPSQSSGGKYAGPDQGLSYITRFLAFAIARVTFSLAGYFLSSPCSSASSRPQPA